MAVAVFVLVALAGAPVFGQTGQAELRGTVTDDSGAVLPDATVTATHVDTGSSRPTVTSATGVFLMSAMPVGPYRLQLELAGFNTVVQENLPLEVGQQVVLSFTMKVATLQKPSPSRVNRRSSRRRNRNSRAAHGVAGGKPAAERTQLAGSRYQPRQLQFGFRVTY